MREYAINYTGGDIRFSTFAAIVVAVPIAEIFGIMGQTLVAPWSPRPPMGSPMPFTACATASANSEVLKEAPMMPADARRRKTATEAALDMAVVRIYICIVRVRMDIYVYGKKISTPSSKPGSHGTHFLLKNNIIYEIKVLYLQTLASHLTTYIVEIRPIINRQNKKEGYI